MMAECDTNSSDYVASQRGQNGKEAVTNEYPPAIDMLPDEIMSMIFQLGKERWRNIVLSSPLLWNRLVFQTCRSGDKHPAIQRQEEYIKRSGDCPLDIHICAALDVGLNNPIVVDACLSYIMDLIIPHATRWKSVIMELTTRTGAVEVLRRLQPLAVPQLDYLRISYEPDLTGEIPRTPLFEGGAPTLCTIRLSGLGLHQSPPPLANLRELQLYRDGATDIKVTAAAFQELLKAVPRLERLHLVGSLINFDAGTEPMRTVSLPSLRHITIALGKNIYLLEEMEPSLDFHELMVSLTAPKLQSLYLYGLVGDSTLKFYLKSIIASGTLPYPDLQTLLLQRIEEEIDGLLWRVFPSINHLLLAHVPWYSLASQLEEACTNRGTSPLPWPNLERLSCTDSYGSHNAAIRACVEAGHPLRSFSVLSRDLWNSPLSDLSGLGLDISEPSRDIFLPNRIMVPSLIWERDEPGYDPSLDSDSDYAYEDDEEDADDLYFGEMDYDRDYIDDDYDGWSDEYELYEEDMRLLGDWEP
ncbi:hypothetical protein PUNSTDRAFT_130227 [Punctularia strigosozonata HHB-11173 SS5]|uniref:uncharacterized protein n=1 Tax=Punctularia strigosozonata (strain HHB-11173) TaxID=741275 RepID=UPI0004416992|nr:uncharacterized protein PUNSTDRAFT_130227 [Punctularia strigosozonata HHB-11173 SS5]EIN14602.1 hypothetical protein PUNSTDRAFT_130227 [Punctularia strigosozonata HHB-11173 SS5]